MSFGGVKLKGSPHSSYATGLA